MIFAASIAPAHAQVFKTGSFTKTTTTAVSFQNSASASSNSATTLTISSFNPGSNGNRLLVVGISSTGVGTGMSVAYGGVALTLATGTSVTNGTTHTEIWYLVNPSSTAADIVASWTTAQAIVMGAVAFNNVDQATPISGGITASATSTTPSVTIASRTNDMVLAVAGKLTNLGTDPVTSRWHDVSQAAQKGGGTTTAGAASVARTWTAAATSTAWSASGINIRFGASQQFAHGLGIAPKALMLWTEGRTAAGFSASSEFAFGITDGSTSRSVATASQHLVGTSNASRRTAAKALTLVQWGEVTVVEADFTSWDATNVNLTWTTNDTNAYVVHYLVLGGTSVQAKVVEWQAPAAGSLTNVGVNTVGFQPNAVLHLTDGDSGVVGTNLASASLSLGVMDGDDQWVTSNFSRDAAGTSDTSRAQLTDNSAVPSCILELSNNQTTLTQAKFVSMDANGFTVKFDTNTNGSARIFSLALAGMNMKAGTFNKVTGNATPAFVQQVAKNAGAVASTTQTFGSVSTSGNLVVVTVSYDGNRTINSITDTKGNAYTLAVGPTTWGSTSNLHTATYYASNIIGGGTAITITATLSGAASSFFEVYQLEYSGVSTVSPLDQTSAATGASATLNSGSKATTQVNELVYGYGAGQTQTATKGATFTARSTFDSNYASDKTAAAIGSYSSDGTMPSSDNWVAQMATFKGNVQAVTGNEFQPTAVMLVSAQNTTSAATATSARLGIGASDGTTETSTAHSDTDNLNTTSVQGYDSVAKVFTKVDNSTSTISAEADLVSLDTDGFTLNWTTNDAVATEILYWSFAPLSVTAVDLVSLAATRYNAGVLVQWRTGYEIDNLGFNVYREISGVRTKINGSLIAGSALQGVNAVQNYARWDTDADAANDSVAYWLEDVDLNGTSTFHGPVSPAAGGLQTVDPSVTMSSIDLNDLGSPHDNRTVFYDIPNDPVRIGRRDLQWDLASQSAVKIGVRKAGWYRVSQPDLIAAGLDPAVDPHRLRLFLNGIEQAIRVNGEGDGQFDAGDSIEFYGTGANTPYTDTRFYWLVAGAQNGLRIGVDATPVTATPSSGGFASLRQRKDRSIYFAALNNGDTENWFGPVISSTPTDLTLATLNVDRTATGASLDVTLQGVTSSADGNASGHAVGVLMNGTDVGEIDFQGRTHLTQTLPIPIDALSDGTNTVTLVARGDDQDVSLVDLIAVRYSHTYRADADLLRLTLDAGAAATIGGFGSPAIHVVDITDPAAVTELQGSTQPENGGLYSITVQAPGSGTRTLFAFSELTVATAASVAANQPSTWHAASQSNDYVVVSHGDFVAKMAPLASLRAAEGHHPAVVNIEDVYDEFSFGEKTPLALKDFLRWAQSNWHEVPKFVVLAGDATTDPRDYMEMGNGDFVPTKDLPMSTQALETASDDWFVDFNDDGLPDMAIGRLSVRTPAQAETVVGKIVAYGQLGAEAWNKNVVLAADQNDDTNFEATSERLAALMPQDFAVHRVYRGTLGDAVARQSLIDQVNNGQFIVNYLGHGSVHLWTDGNPPLLQNAYDGQPVDDVLTTWTNLARLPFVVAMNCLNGLFNGVFDEESLAETLQRAPNGGAIAVWASSSVTPPAVQALANQELFRLIFTGQYPTVGEAVSAAKHAVANPDLRRSWVFFGDPATRLNGQPPYVPPPPPPPPPVPDPEPPAPGGGGGGSAPGDTPEPPPASSTPTAPTPPGAPAGLTSSVFGSSVMLAWNAPSSGSAPQSYVVEAGTFSGARDVVFDTGTTATTFTANGVSAGTYFVRVRSHNDVGTSEASNEVILIVTGATSSATPAAPGAPVGLSVTVTGNVVRFAWAASVAGGAPQTYWIDAGSSSMQSDLASFSTGSAATSMTVPGVPAGTYYIRVRAANAVGISGASNEVIAVVGGSVSCSVPPDPPSALRATVSGSTVALAWAGGAGTPTSYIVEAGSQFGAADLTVSDTGSSATTMVATGVGRGTYFVRVRARNACGISGASNETVIVVP